MNRLQRLTLCLLCFSTTAFAILPTQEYRQPILVKNELNTSGYFSVCKHAISPTTETLCSTPQKIQPGDNLLFIPDFKDKTPILALANEFIYTCASSKNPKAQFGFQGNHIVLISFIQDAKGNNVAIQCGEPGEPNANK
ncbi:MAG: hypothetical protein ABIH77_02450 [Pseudomonadota bacterium]|nr:hypothetical protein [Gammaproteobacteria bacterium]MBU1559090.1 hypothetical protein [Gammaproteobacteria bacterium]MBU1628618.1 hypothetical protein [Gammaproteobacteria bacterium]MBU1926886.1 hypothetical protein [Gammaproteobacteria bacterium]MBU2545903.1 hypothetical protein [Gammaproteobacteria bacterium]